VGDSVISEFGHCIQHLESASTHKSAQSHA